MAIIYKIGIRVYFTLVKIVGLFSQRARQFTQSRSLSPLRQSPKHDGANLWIHCASHGEYETAKPLINRYGSRFNIHLTFYSPSGYQVAIDEPKYWTTLRYLAYDHSSKLKAQIHDINPKYVIFIQYEYWYLLLKNLSELSIPYLYYGVQLTESHLLKRPLAKFLREKVNQSQLILTRDAQSQIIGEDLFTTQVVEVGDVRWLQAAANQSQPYSFPFDLTPYEQVIVIGSAWIEDLRLWYTYIESHPRTCFIIAPHDISDDSVGKLISPLNTRPDIWLDHQGEMMTQLESNILIVNILGQLKYLYRIADLAYIGGGLGSGLHNSLEAAIYGTPVLVAGDVKSNPEVRKLIDSGLADRVNTPDDLDHTITKLHATYNKTKATAYLAASLKKSQQAYSLIDKILDV